MTDATKTRVLRVHEIYDHITLVNTYLDDYYKTLDKLGHKDLAHGAYADKRPSVRMLIQRITALTEHKKAILEMDTLTVDTLTAQINKFMAGMVG